MANLENYGVLCGICGKFVSCTATKYEDIGLAHDECVAQFREAVADVAKEYTREVINDFKRSFFAPLIAELKSEAKTDKPS